MNAIDNYNQIKNKVARFEQWANLLGKEYFGGTRGKGREYGKVVSAHGKLTIYHQEYDGANNYHDLNKEFDDVLESAMIQNASTLIDSMRKSLNQQLGKAREEAAKLVKEIEGQLEK